MGKCFSRIVLLLVAAPLLLTSEVPAMSSPSVAVGINMQARDGAPALKQIGVNSTTTVQAKKTETVNPDMQAWQKRRLQFLKTVQEVRKGNASAQKALNATLTEFETHPFSRTPMENMDILGVFYLPKDGVEKTLPVIAATAVLGMYDALRFGSKSGQEEILRNEGFLKRPFLIAGNGVGKKADEFLQKNPERVSALVEQGIKLAESLRDDPRYDHHWPSAYGLERIICAEGGSCTPPSGLPKNQWSRAWDEARKLVIAYYISPAGPINSKNTQPSFPGKLTLTREVFLEKGMFPKPNVIVRTKDNGFVIAGGLGRLQEGWATRVDAEGNVKWRYLVPSPDKSAFDVYPTYSSAAVMPDDSVFLCGHMTGHKGESWRGLLTHLDRDGKVLNEQFFLPHVSGEAVVSNFDACTLIVDSLVIVGHTSSVQHMQPTASHPLPYDEEDFYWIVSFSGDGKVKWEKLIPFGKNAGTQELTVTHASDNGFLFAAGRNGFETEIMHVSSSGDIEARNIISKSFMLVHPVEPDGKLQLISTDSPMDSDPIQLTLVTLNDKLQETGRITESHEPGTVKQTYRLPDQSLMLFGGISRPGHSSFARVMKLDPTLKHEQVLELTSEPDTSFWVEAAAPLDKPGQFAFVREVSDADGNNSHIALDFVALKPPPN